RIAARSRSPALRQPRWAARCFLTGSNCCAMLQTQQRSQQNARGITNDEFRIMRHSLKTILPRARALLLASALFGFGRPAVFAQAPTTGQRWAYSLLHDSYLLADCPVCDRLSI